MYIEKLDAWTDIGYTEDSLYVPYNHDVQKEPSWSLERVRPPFTNLIGFLRLPINDTDRTLEIYSNTKYLRIKFSHIDYPIYAWVDGASPISKKVAGISWHIDIWRTYFHKCKFQGWIRKRKFDDFKTHPYQEYPAFYTHATKDEIPICDQRRGIYWVIITFVEGPSYFSEFFKSVAAVIPGAKEFKDLAPIAIEGLKGIMSSMNTYAKRGYSPPSTSGEIGTRLPIIGDFSVIRCLTFPISSNLTENIYFRSEGGEGSAYNGPTYREILAGTLAKVFDIRPNNLISAFVSPVCPFNLSDDVRLTGLTPQTPLEISRSQHLNQSFTLVKRLQFSSRRDVLTIRVIGQGFYHLNKKEFADKEQKNRLTEVLTNHYNWCYKIRDVSFSIKDKKYKISVEQPVLSKETDKKETYLFVPFSVVVNEFFPIWKMFTFFYVQDEDMSARIVHYTGDSIKGWTIGYEEKEDVTNINVFYDKGNYNPNELEFIPKKTDKIIVDHDIVRFYDHDRFLGVSTMDRLYIRMCDKDTWTDPNITFYKKLPNVSTYDGGAAYKIGIFRSLQDFSGVAAIQSATLTWPVIYQKLPKVYATDDFHDLLLIDQNGTVIHRFKKGREYSSYNYQLVTASNNAFIKIIFNEQTNNVPVVSGNEVHIPLTSITVPVTYSNVLKTMNESAQRFMSHYYESKKIAEDRILEAERINLDRRKEDSGIMATGIDLIKETMSGLMSMMGGMNAAMSTVGKGIDALVGVVNTTYKGMGKAAKSLPVIGGMFNGWDTDNDLITSNMGDQFKTAVNYGAERIANVGLSKGEIRQDENKNREKQQKADDKYRDYLNGVGAFAWEPSVTSTTCITDASFINLFGTLRLVYLTKDDYSANEHLKTLQYLGVDVNEYTNYTSIPDGPIKVDPVFVLGKDVPPSAQEYIRRRLEAGVYVDKDL